MSKNLAKSLAADGILVNTISPGTIVTASFTEALDPFLAADGLDSSNPVDVMTWIENNFHQPADLGRAGRPRRDRQHHRVPGVAAQRLRDRRQRQRRRRIGLRLTGWTGSARSMDIDQMVATACERAGSDDFGEDTWQEALEVLVRSLDDEAALNEIGRRAP